MQYYPKNLKAFFIHFVRPYRSGFGGMVMSIVLISVLTALNPWLMKVIVDRITHFQGGMAISVLLDKVLWPLIFFALTYQAIDLGWVAYDYFKLKTVPHVRADVIAQTFSYLQGHAYSFFQKNFSGSLSNKVANLAKSSSAIVSDTVDPLFTQVVSTLILAGAMGFVHPMFTLMLLVWAVIFIAIALWYAKRTLAFAATFSEANSICMGVIVDSISNMMNAKLFARARFEMDHLTRFIQDSLVKDQRLQWLLLKLRMRQGFTIFVLFAAITAFLVYQYALGKVTIGDFSFIWTSSIYIMQGLWYLSNQLLNYSQDLGVCRESLAIVNVPHEIVDLPNAKPLKVSKGQIDFDKVTFYYSKGLNVFRDKSLHIEGGQKVGLVGFSGSGKTTFTSLILRLFDIHGGRILIDGQNIAEVTQDSLRAQITMIPQEPTLFHRSLMENIRYGRLDAMDEEVIEASKQAHCHEFILQQKQGYDTLVGERGLKLSGGQRQRIAVARAILKQAPILILDEATSALDSITEQKIKESVNYLMEGKTTLVIAHRLSTLSHMDRILVFEGGCVVEDGTHDELIEQNGHYAKLWNMQVGGFLLDSTEEEDEDGEEEED